jgi:WD40 repeat protein
MEHDQLWSIASSPEESRPLVAIGCRHIYFRNSNDGREERKIDLDEGSSVSRLAFVPGGKTLAAVCLNDGAIRLWHAADGRPLGSLTGKNQYVSQFAFSPDGKHLAATGQQGRLSVWDLATGRESESFATKGLADGALVFTPDGAAIAAKGGKANHIWDRNSGKDRIAVPEVHQESVQRSFSSTGVRTLLSGSDDRTVRLWDLQSASRRAGRQRAIFRHEGWVRAIAVSRNERWLAVRQSYPESGPVFLWHIPTGRPRRSFGSPAQGVHPTGLRLSDDGTALDVCWSDGSLRSYEMVTIQERTVVQPAILRPPLQFPGIFAKSEMFSNNGRLIALLGHKGGGIHVAQLENGKELFELARGGAAAFSPDSKILAIVDRPQSKMIELADGRSRSDLRDSDAVNHLVDSRTGKEFRRSCCRRVPSSKPSRFHPTARPWPLARAGTVGKSASTMSATAARSGRSPNRAVRMGRSRFHSPPAAIGLWPGCPIRRS